MPPESPPSTPAAPSALFANRRLRVCYWNAASRVLDADSMGLETHLARLGDVQIDRLKTLEGAALGPCDLLIVAAQLVPPQEFTAWLRALKQRIAAQGRIWIPALILADVPFDVLSEILPEAAGDNWYFDILAPAHVASLPIRVANLLRIHDHLHEMKRYAAALDDVTAKVTILESQMRDLRAPNKPEPTDKPKA